MRPRNHSHLPLAGTSLYCLGNRSMCVNNLPKIVTWKQNGRESNPRPSTRSNTITIIPSGHERKSLTLLCSHWGISRSMTSWHAKCKCVLGMMGFVCECLCIYCENLWNRKQRWVLSAVAMLSIFEEYVNVDSRNAATGEWSVGRFFRLCHILQTVTDSVHTTRCNATVGSGSMNWALETNRSW